jgi:hypothetical protein
MCSQGLPLTITSRNATGILEWKHPDRRLVAGVNGA